MGWLRALWDRLVNGSAEELAEAERYGLGVPAQRDWILALGRAA